MVTPEKALEILTGMYKPPRAGATKLVLKNFAQLSQISDLSLGSEVTLRGNVTYVSPLREADLDIHFDLGPPGANRFVVCEIQNADTNLQGQPLQQAMEAGSTVEVKGVLRIFPEHVYASAGATLAHIFEIHPIREVNIDGAPLMNVEMDCPGKDGFATQPSVHAITIEDDATMKMVSSGRRIGDNIKVAFDGTDLTMMKPPHLNVNYVWSSCYLSFDNSGSFNDGQPFNFEIRGSNDPNATPVRSVVIPGTPAYDDVQKYVDNPPTDAVGAALLRSLDIQHLMNSKYEVIFAPVYRFQ